MAKAAAVECPLTPLSSRIVVELIEGEEMTPGGIALPDQARANRHRGKVLAVGPGWVTANGETVPPQVEVGDTVFFRPHDAEEIKAQGGVYWVLDERSVLAKAN